MLGACNPMLCPVLFLFFLFFFFSLVLFFLPFFSFSLFPPPFSPRAPSVFFGFFGGGQAAAWRSAGPRRGAARYRPQKSLRAAAPSTVSAQSARPNATTRCTRSRAATTTAGARSRARSAATFDICSFVHLFICFPRFLTDLSARYRPTHACFDMPYGVGVARVSDADGCGLQPDAVPVSRLLTWA